MQILNTIILLVLLVMSFFLICLVLIQRGKGGGLAGAFGGVGGSSAFGTKAGDVFTKVTMVSAGIWIVINMILVNLSNQHISAWNEGAAPGTGPGASSPFNPATSDGKSTSPAESLDKMAVPPLPETKKGNATEPAVPVSGGSPAAPLPLPVEPSPSSSKPNP